MKAGGSALVSDINFDILHLKINDTKYVHGCVCLTEDVRSPNFITNPSQAGYIISVLK
jgi:hypothetical protein